MIDRDTKLTPNVKRLLLERVSIEAVPNGGGLNAGLTFLSSKENITAGFSAALEWVNQALIAVRNAAAPNPFASASDEEIATELMCQIIDKKKGRR